MRSPSLRSSRYRSSNRSSSVTVNTPLTNGRINGATKLEAIPTARPSASVRLSRPTSLTEIGWSPADARLISMHGEATGSAKKQCTWSPNTCRKPKVIPPGAPPNAARQIDEQRMVGIDRDRLRRKLLLQAQGSDAVAEEQAFRVFVVDEICVGTATTLLASGCNRVTEISGVLDHCDAARTQPLLLPGFGVGGHVHDGVEPERCGHDSDAQSEIAGRADGDLMAREQRSRLSGRQRRAILLRTEHTVPERETLCVQQHFIDAAAGFDGAGNRQSMIRFDEPSAWCGIAARQGLLQLVGREQRRLDDAIAPGQLREQLRQQTGKSMPAPLRVVHVVESELRWQPRGEQRSPPGIDP